MRIHDSVYISSDDSSMPNTDLIANKYLSGNGGIRGDEYISND